jgi:hypothetical protein
MITGADVIMTGVAQLMSSVRFSDVLGMALVRMGELPEEVARMGPV